jgi:hypothetical protein
MTQYVIPEFPSFLILPLFMITTLLTVAYTKRKPCRTEGSSQAERGLITHAFRPI